MPNWPAPGSAHYVMLLVRSLIFILLLSAGVSFALYAYTSQPRFKRYGLTVLKWTLVAAFGFFAVLIVQQMV